MFAAIVYTVLSALNLIGFTVGVVCLPAEVPIHFNVSMTADAVGSPWVFVSLPAAAALISAAIWTASMKGRAKSAKITKVCLAAVGAVLTVIGWVFFALIASGVQAGEKAEFPVALCIVMPLCLLFVFLGTILHGFKWNVPVGLRTASAMKSSRIFEKASRLFGILLILSGAASAALSAVLACLAARMVYVSAVVLVCGILIAGFAGMLYARAAAKKEVENEMENGENGEA